MKIKNKKLFPFSTKKSNINLVTSMGIGILLNGVEIINYTFYLLSTILKNFYIDWALLRTSFAAKTSKNNILCAIFRQNKIILQ